MCCSEAGELEHAELGFVVSVIIKDALIILLTPLRHVWDEIVRNNAAVRRVSCSFNPQKMAQGSLGLEWESKEKTVALGSLSLLGSSTRAESDLL